MLNQTPEQIARDHIDKQLTACGWIMQGIKQVNLHVGIGVAVKEYHMDVGLQIMFCLLRATPLLARHPTGDGVNIITFLTTYTTISL